MEKYLREFLSEMIRLLLEAESRGGRGLLKKAMAEIEHHQAQFPNWRKQKPQ